MSERECYISQSGVIMPQNLRALTLDLPFPPSLNTYWRHVGDRVLVSKQGRIFQKAVAQIVMQQKAALAITRPVQVFICWQPVDNRKRDIDNYIKALFDAMTYAKVWLDDSLVRDLHVTWGDIVKPGKSTVQIIEMANLPKLGACKNV